MELNSEPKCSICYKFPKTSICTQCSRILSSTIPGLTIIPSNPFAHIENLVFQGGGVKGAAYLGVLEQLERESNGSLQRVKRVAGSSAGSLVALYLALNLPLLKIRNLVVNQKYKDFLDDGIGLEIKGEKKKVKAKSVFLKTIEYYKKLKAEPNDETASLINEISKDIKHYYVRSQPIIQRCCVNIMVDQAVEYLKAIILGLLGYSYAVKSVKRRADDDEIVFEEPVKSFHEGEKSPIDYYGVIEPHTFIKEVEVVETRPTLKEIEVSEPVRVVKDVQYIKAVPVKKLIEVDEPQVVTKEVEVIEPRLVTKTIQVVENVPVKGQAIEPRIVTKTIQAVENVPVKRLAEVVEMRNVVQEFETFEPRTFHKQVEVTEYVPVKRQVEVTAPVTLKKAVEFVEPVITTQTITKEINPVMPIIIDKNIKTKVIPATLIGDIDMMPDMEQVEVAQPKRAAEFVEPVMKTQTITKRPVTREEEIKVVATPVTKEIEKSRIKSLCDKICACFSHKRLLKEITDFNLSVRNDRKLLHYALTELLLQIKKSQEDGFEYEWDTGRIIPKGEATKIIEKLIHHSGIKKDEQKKEPPFGIFTGDGIKSKLIRDPIMYAFRHFGYELDSNGPTFKEMISMKDENGKRLFKDLYVTTFNSATNRTQIFSAEHTPHVFVIDAVRASMSIPGFFRPVYISQKNGETEEKRKIYFEKEGKQQSEDILFMDGGILDNYPLWIFDDIKYLIPNTKFQAENQVTMTHRFTIQNPKTLGFRLLNKMTIDRYTKPYVGDNLTQMKRTNENSQANAHKWTFLFGNLWGAKMEQEENEFIKFDNCPRTLYIDNAAVSAISFDMDKEIVDNLIKNGEDSVKKYKERYNLGFLHEGQAYPEYNC